MDEKRFNLLDEPWIRVMTDTGDIHEVSLLEGYRDAHRLMRLSGELPTQDVAVFRLLLSILYTVISRYDINGEFSPIKEPSDAINRWCALWEKKQFPYEVIGDYLRQYHDRFYLFHPKRPFYQISEMTKATYYTACKLNGAISESGNKIRLFSQRSGQQKDFLEYAEAARWLLHINAFDDTAGKSPREEGKKKLPSPGTGWLGKLGLVMAVGDTLFETLLLNLVMLPDGENITWGEGIPVWELAEPRRGERTKIEVPKNPSELLTVQSRRLLLDRVGDRVVGYSLLGGDFFAKENVFVEQMTVWRYGKSNDDKQEKYRPYRHDPSRQLWRDFPALLVQSENQRRPGVVNWLAKLMSEQRIIRKQFQFMTIGVAYGAKDCSLEDVFSDSITMNASVLKRLRNAWIHRISEELLVTSKLVEELGRLALNIRKAAGDKGAEGQIEVLKEQAYFRLDQPFRRWLSNLDPETDDLDDVCDDWWRQARAITLELGRKTVDQAGAKAFIGRTVKEKRRGKEMQVKYSAPDAYNWFIKRTINRQALKGGANE